GSAHYAELARGYRNRGLARGADRSGAVTLATPPMTRREWDDLLARLAQAPARVESRPQRHESFARDGRGRESEDHRRLPVVEAMVKGAELPVLQDEGGGAPHDLGSWRDVRGRLADRLAACGPTEWGRPIGHPTRGARTLADWVREWVE